MVSDREEASSTVVEISPAQQPKDPRRKWYVIHTYSGYENKVKRTLEHRISTLGVKDRVFNVLVPTEEDVEIKNGQRRTVTRRIYPGYVLVEMILDEETWDAVRNTPGVTGFVGTGTQPSPLSDQEVEAILKRMKAGAPKVKIALARGQAVRIIDGPFADFEGTVDDVNQDKGKVRVLVSFFGRETPVEVDFLQVEKIT